MASIEDFVNHRWTDAKSALAKLDGGFVRRLDSQVRLDALNLTAPWPSHELEREPAKRLETSWHRLLEACAEMALQATVLEETANSLTADANRNIPSVAAGKRAVLYLRSWPIHAQALKERVCNVVEWTNNVYVDDLEARAKSTRYYKEYIEQELSAGIREVRNQYVHGVRSWEKGITEDELWEGLVVVGLTPSRYHNEFVYPEQGDYLKLGKYNGYAAGTNQMHTHLGSILEELEVSVASL